MHVRKYVVLLVAFLFATGALANSAEQYLKQGVAAFKQSRYTDAVKHFKQARKAGMKGTHLDYNLGVTYYKLEKYDLAKEMFLTVTTDQKYRQMAYYNLGLISRRQKDNKKALVWFRKAAGQDHSKQVRQLAEKMIKRLEKQAPRVRPLVPNTDQNIFGGSRESFGMKKKATTQVSAYNDPAATDDTVERGTAEDVEVIRAPTRKDKKKARRKKPTGGFQIAYGRDSEIEFVGTELSSNQSDNYIEAFGYVDIPVWRKLSVFGQVYYQDFDTLDSDFRSYRIGARYSFRSGVWTFTPELAYSSNELAGEDYTNSLDYTLRMSRSLGKGKWLSLRAIYSDIDGENNAGGSDYSEESGSRIRLRADYFTKTGFGRLRLRYQFESNDRDDPAGVAAIDSVSPTRHTFRARLNDKFKSAPRWYWSTELEYRSSTYDDESGAPEGDREDDRFRVRLDVNRKMNRNWRLGILGVFTNNSSNYSSADYSKSDIQIYSFWRF